MKGTVHQLVSGRYGVFVDQAKGLILISLWDTYEEALKAADRVYEHSHFKVNGLTVHEVRIDEWGRKETRLHHCGSDGELHRVKLRLLDQGLFEAVFP